MTNPHGGGATDPYRPLPTEPPVGPPVPYGTTPSPYQPPAPEPSALTTPAPPAPVQQTSWSVPGSTPYGGYPAPQMRHPTAPPYYGPHQMPYGPQAGATNTLAVLALVFGIIFPIVGIILGHAARRQIRMTGESGDGLAIAGLIIGYATSALFCAGFGSLFLSAAFGGGGA